MNIHVSDKIRQDWENYEFVGKPFVLKNGKTYIRARSKTFNQIHYYCFQENFIWWDKNDILTV